jgi:glycosyltransferase involved in cell wall biosynthesis
MRIAVIAPPFLPCPPLGYGGIERVVANLCDGLAAGGHDIVLSCHPDSTCGVDKKSYLETTEDYYDMQSEIAHVARAMVDSGGFDIVHNHTEAGIALDGLSECPIVHTVHGIADRTSMKAIFESNREANYVGLSADQQRHFPNLNWIATVANGVDTDVFQPSAENEGYLLHLGALARGKGTAEAIEIARDAGKQLVLAGIPDPKNPEYFDTEISHQIDDSTVKFVGEVSGKTKTDLIANAAGLLFPAQWNEPFGLVLLEALASGVPVVSTARGAAAEILDDGVTGILEDDWRCLAGRIGELADIDGQVCRKAAVENYSVDAMVEKYLTVYDDVINR